MYDKDDYTDVVEVSLTILDNMSFEEIKNWISEKRESIFIRYVLDCTLSNEDNKSFTLEEIIKRINEHSFVNGKKDAEIYLKKAIEKHWILKENGSYQINDLPF